MLYRAFARWLKTLHQGILGGLSSLEYQPHVGWIGELADIFQDIAIDDHDVCQFAYLKRPYLVLYMLFSEYLVAEQAGIYSRAQGLGKPRR